MTVQRQTRHARATWTLGVWSGRDDDHWRGSAWGSHHLNDSDTSCLSLQELGQSPAARWNSKTNLIRKSRRRGISDVAGRGLPGLVTCVLSLSGLDSLLAQPGPKQKWPCSAQISPARHPALCCRAFPCNPPFPHFQLCLQNQSGRLLVSPFSLHHQHPNKRKTKPISIPAKIKPLGLFLPQHQPNARLPHFTRYVCTVRSTPTRSWLHRSSPPVVIANATPRCPPPVRLS